MVTKYKGMAKLSMMVKLAASNAGSMNSNVLNERENSVWANAPVKKAKNKLTPSKTNMANLGSHNLAQQKLQNSSAK